jgi:hypothetical protein
MSTDGIASSTTDAWRGGRLRRAVVMVAIAMIPAKSSASECIGFGLPHMLDISTIVFSGKVRSIEKLSASDNPYREVARVTLDVRQVFKGAKTSRVILDEWSPTGITDFDNPFVLGRIYSVFAMDNRQNAIASAPRSALVARHCDVREVDAAGERLLANQIRAAETRPSSR